MKKRKFIFLILLVFLSGCASKMVTATEFCEKAEYNGYIIENDKSGYTSYVNIINVYYAYNREDAYYIQFLELDNDDYAHKFFLHNKDDILKDISNNDYVKTKEYDDYELYHVENSSLYLLVIRTGTNIIYIKAPIGYINEIEEFLGDLGLEY